MSTGTVCSAATGWFHACEILRCRKWSNEIGLDKKYSWPVIQPYTSHQSMESRVTQHVLRKFSVQPAFAYSSIALQPIRINKIHVIAELTAL